jgi:hypothetical protein
MGPLGLRPAVAQRSPRAQPSTAQRGLRAPPSTSGPSGAVSGSGAIRKRRFSSELRSSKSPVVQLAQSGRSPLRCASRLRIAWIVSIGGARCSRQLAIQPSGQAVIADDQCSGTRARFLPAPLPRRKSGGRFDGSAFEQVGSGPFREPSVGAGAGDVDGHLLGQSCDLV